MNAKQKVKWLILLRAFEWIGEEAPPICAENIEQLYADMSRKHPGEMQDSESEIREGDCKTELPTQFNRHYECDEVAACCPDGTWVGWTYWYGGGKHGSPEEIEWISEAYDVTCQEEEKMTIVRTFRR